MDLATRTSYRLREFFDGTESPATLANAVSWLDRERTSYLSWAQANDVERAELAAAQAAQAGKPSGKRKPSIETFEYTPSVELLAQLFVLAQKNVHASYTHGSKAAKKRPKIVSYPTPSTASKRIGMNARRQALDTVESMITFSDDPYLGEDSDLVWWTPSAKARARERARAADPDTPPVTGNVESARARPNRMLPPDRGRALEAPLVELEGPPHSMHDAPVLEGWDEPLLP